MLETIKKDSILIQRASFSERFIAFFIDIVVTWLPLTIIFNLTSIQSKALIVSFSYFVAYMLYFGVYPYFNNGQTVGKRILKIKIITIEGYDLTIAHFLVRFFVADGFILISKGLPYNQIIGLIWPFTYLLALREDRRTLVDLLVGTQVIKI